jgi:hypothetical protein
VTETKTELPSEHARPTPNETAWLRPGQGETAQPIWGNQEGLTVGLWPERGPRGLIRVYAPYLGQRRPRMVNFISIEPVVKGVRGQSELEIGSQSKQTGLMMWTADTREAVAAARASAPPALGRMEREKGKETLTFFLATEPFHNGARPLVQVLFRADRPREVGFRLWAARDSAPMDSCVLSATMGNYGRLRRLWLRGEVVDSRKLWPAFQPDAAGFAPWRAWARERLFKQGDDVLVAATPDETDPAAASYDPGVPRHWRYEGEPATQYWRSADVAGLVVRVNGRTTYWGDNQKIPGGIAYENFELEAPFAEGQEFWFGVTREAPDRLGFQPEWQHHLTDGK